MSGAIPPLAFQMRHGRPSNHAFSVTGASSRNPRIGAPGFARSARQPRKRLAWPIRAFLVALVVPWVFKVGALTLPTPRLFLTAILVPCLIKWIRGGAGRIRGADFAILLFCLWCTLSLAVVHGADVAIQSGGMLFVETAGAYFLARCYIRNADDFLNMTRALFRLAAFLLPFALIETTTGQDILLRLFSAIHPSYDSAGDDVRAGFHRVQAVFDHPILYGICVGSTFALTHLVLGRGLSTTQRWLRTGIVGLAALLSLSSAPIAAVAMQGMLMVWNWAFRGNAYRWKLLWALCIVSYIAVAIGSNQTPVQFYISHLTFDPQTGWHRLLIWQYGSASVLNNPLFGIGFGEWTRESWMSSSVDMFWLLYAMRHGLPAGILILSAFFLLFLPISFRSGLDERLDACRTAYSIAMMSFFVVGWTVHFWGMAYSWFIFMLGSGAWLLDVRTENVAARSSGRPKEAQGKALGPRCPSPEPHKAYSNPKVGRTPARQA